MSLVVNVFEIKATVTIENDQPFKVIEYIGVPPDTTTLKVIEKFELYLKKLNKNTPFTAINITSFNLMLKKVYI